MAHLYRLICCLLALATGGTAFAQVACQVEFRGTHSQKPSYLVIPGRSVDNLSTVCSWGNSFYPLAAGAPTYQLVGAGATTSCGRWNGSTWEQSGIGVTSQKWYIKSDGSATQTDPGPVCSCPAGTVLVNGSCVTPPDPCAALAGKEAGLKVWNGTASSFSFCDGWNPTGNGKCVVTALKDLSWQTSPTSGVWLSQGIGVYSGSSATSCTGDGGTGTTPAPSTPTPDGLPPQQPAPGEAAPSPCPSGQAPGSINGASVCAPRGSDIPVEGTDTKKVVNPDGSITRTDGTTRCQNGKCETDTRVCKSASVGAAETCETTTTSEAQAGFCDANKGAKVCQGQGEGTPTSFGGTCAAGFKAVSDDAVINAMAAEIYRQNCKVNPDDAETTLAKTERMKTGDQTKDNPNNGSFSIAPGSIDTSDALGGAASCISDKSITVMGYQAVVIPFSTWCNGFPLLGNLLLAVSFLLAGVIILRR